MPTAVPPTTKNSVTEDANNIIVLPVKLTIMNETRFQKGALSRDHSLYSMQLYLNLYQLGKHTKAMSVQNVYVEVSPCKA